MLVDGFSLEFEWHQISSSLQDSSQYSGPPQQCCRLDSHDPSSKFQVLPSFFNSLARLRYLSFFSLSFRFILWSAGTAKSTILKILFFFVGYYEAGIRWSVCMLMSHRSLCESFSRTGAGLCIYLSFVWSNWKVLQISLWITLPTQSCLDLYSYAAFAYYMIDHFVSVTT